MTSPPTTEPQSLVALLLASKKALQHGEQLCERAHAYASASSKSAVDALALDARVRWIGGVVGEQFKVRGSVHLTLYNIMLMSDHVLACR
jgi:autophagy-related protein 17